MPRNQVIVAAFYRTSPTQPSVEQKHTIPHTTYWNTSSWVASGWKTWSSLYLLTYIHKAGCGDKAGSTVTWIEAERVSIFSEKNLSAEVDLANKDLIELHHEKPRSVSER